MQAASSTTRTAKPFTYSLHALAPPALFGLIVTATVFLLSVRMVSTVSGRLGILPGLGEFVLWLASAYAGVVAAWWTMRRDERNRVGGFPDLRLQATLLVVGSGVLLFLLGWVLQAAAYVALERARAADTDLPRLTWWITHMFGLKPHSYALAVTTWFWWPMVLTLIHCHLRYPQRRIFAVKFVFGLAMCWLLFALAVAMAGTGVALMEFCLCADMEEPPAVMAHVNWITIALPVATIASGLPAAWWFRRKPARL